MMKRMLISVILGLLLPFAVIAQDRPAVLPIHAIYIPLLLANDGSGPFADLIHEIGRRAGLRFEIVVLPPQRQRMAFGMKQIDIIFPMVASSFDAQTEYIRSSSFFDKKYFAFTRKGSPCVRSVADLAKLPGLIGLTFGYSYPRSLLSEPHLSFDYAPSDDQNMIKVSLGRTTAFVVEEVSGLAALKHTKQEALIQYDPQSPLYIEDVFFALQKKEDLVPVRDAISRAINDMKTDGSLRKMLGNLQPASAEQQRAVRPVCP